MRILIALAFSLVTSSGVNTVPAGPVTLNCHYVDSQPVRSCKARFVVTPRAPGDRAAEERPEPVWLQTSDSCAAVKIRTLDTQVAYAT